MAHPLELIARREAELDALSRKRGLTETEIAEAERLKARKSVVMLRLPRQIVAAKRKLDRLQRLYFATGPAAPAFTLHI